MNFLNFLVQFRTPVTEQIAQLITYFGQEVMIVAFICICFWCIDKEYAYKAGFAFCLSGILVQGLKLVFRIPRPWILDKNFKPVSSAVKGATGYSFPSGHTQGATSVYGSFALSTKKRALRAVFIITFLLVGFSRMMLGVHTPKDVFTAMAISIPCVFVVNVLYKKLLTASKVLDYSLPALIIIGAIVIFTYGIFLKNHNIVEYKYALDCAQSAGAALGFVVGYFCDKRYNIAVITQNRKKQIIKCVLGLALIALLKKGMKAFMYQSLFAALLCNMILILFIIIIYPLLCNKFLKIKE